MPFDLKRATRILVDFVVQPIKSVPEMTDSSLVALAFDKHHQVDRYSCGAASTYMVLKYYRKARSFENVAKILGTNPDHGTRESSINSLLRKRGLKPRIISTLAEIYLSIEDDEAPVIICAKGFSHWAVVYGFSKHYIFVADPLPHAKVRYTKKEFRNRYWSSHFGIKVTRG